MGVEVEGRIAAVAARQHGVLTLAQLLQAGVTVDGVRSRIGSGRLVRLHLGVYLLGTLVGPLLPARHREMAAILACRRGATVSHRSALWLRELIPARPPGPVNLSLEGGRCRRTGILLRGVASLPASDLDIVDGIPTTAVVRTILDVAALASPRELERVIGRAERVSRLDLDELRARVIRENGRRGIGRLREILARPTPPAFIRSPAEGGFLDLVRKADLPEPEWNVIVDGCEVDAYWRDLGVAVEVDGFAHHSARHPFENDRSRDMAFGASGVQVRRVTWRQINEEPYIVIRRLSAILARAEVRREAAARAHA